MHLEKSHQTRTQLGPATIKGKLPRNSTMDGRHPDYASNRKSQMSSSNVHRTPELHTIKDVSLSAVSAVVFMRTISADGAIATNYAISKSKVPPIKQMTIHKLELEAATLGAELAGFYQTEMKIDMRGKKFRTDSTAVLSWIQSKDRQKIYIANRLNKVAENSNNSSGCYLFQID